MTEVMQSDDVSSGVCPICGCPIRESDPHLNDADGVTHHAVCFLAKRAETAEVALEQERAWRSRSFVNRHGSEAESVAQQEREWERFWKGVVSGDDGELVLDSVKRELHDYSMMLENTSRVFNYSTGGRASKPNTDAQVINDLTDRVNQNVIDLELAEFETDARRYRRLRQLNWSDGGLTVTFAANVRLGSDCPSEDRLDNFIDDMIIADKASEGTDQSGQESSSG